MNIGDRGELVVDRIAGGGDAVGRWSDGRAVFVTGAIPGERIDAEVTEVKKRHGRARAASILDPSPWRQLEPCPSVAAGCGGCDWQHISPTGQSALRLEIVRDALTRIGRLSEPAVEPGMAIPADARRTTVRAAVTDGRAGYRRRGSHRVTVPGSCLVTHPAVESLLVDGRFDGTSEVVLRVGARTGDRLVLATPTAIEVDVPEGVVVVGQDEIAAGAAAHHHEEVSGRRWRISARSFFQASPEAAEALVSEVADAIAVAPGKGRLVDLAAGVGLFAGTVGTGFDEVVAVEPSPSSSADARHNLGADIEVIATTIERWSPTPADVAVVDPPRSGLGQDGVERVAATGAEVVALVSCDAGALGRDAGLLEAAGYALERSRVLDVFAHTSHVEVVSRFVRAVGNR